MAVDFGGVYGIAQCKILLQERVKFDLFVSLNIFLLRLIEGYGISVTVCPAEEIICSLLFYFFISHCINIREHVFYLFVLSLQKHTEIGFFDLSPSNFHEALTAYLLPHVTFKAPSAFLLTGSHFKAHTSNQGSN